MMTPPDPLVAPVVGGTPETFAELVNRLARARWEQYRVDRFESLGDAVLQFADELLREAAALVPRPEPREPEPVEFARRQTWIDYADRWLAHAENQAVGWGNMPAIPVGLVRQMRDELAAVRPASAPSLETTACRHCCFAIRFIDGAWLDCETHASCPDGGENAGKPHEPIDREEVAASAPSRPLGGEKHGRVPKAPGI